MHTYTFRYSIILFILLVWTTGFPASAATLVNSHLSGAGERPCTSEMSIQDTAYLEGIITDEHNKPVEGASVSIKGKPNGTVTDGGGRFILNNVLPGSVLSVHCIGFRSLDTITDGHSIMKIRLKSAIHELSGITVSTGYQLIPKERATGSFDFIDNNTLNQQVGANILDRLQGVASGVTFPKQNMQDGPEFMIRGLSTINGPKDPLVVVDGFPYDGDINNINPNDVASITVLKDAAATSIWGVRAGNGVVVVTTKSGSFDQPVKISFNTGIKITGKPDLSKLRIISSGDYINVERQLFNYGYYDGYLNDTYSYPAVSPVVEILDKEKKGVISSETAESRIKALESADFYKEYSKYIYREAVTQQYAVNLHGGSNSMNYYFSGGFDKTLDELSAPSSRLTTLLSNNFRPFKNLLINLKAQYTWENTKSGKPSYGSILTGNWQVPYLQLADAGGGSLPVARLYRQAYTDTAGNGKLLDWNYYPLEDWKHSTTGLDRRDLSVNLGLAYTITKGLNIDIKYLYERQSSATSSLKDKDSYETRNLINTFTQLDRNSGSVKYIVPVGGILSLSRSTIQSNSLRGQIDFGRNWDRHDLNAIVGSEVRQVSTKGNSAMFYGYDGNTLLSSNIDPVNGYPSFVNGSYIGIPFANGLSSLLNRYISFYGNASYTYDRLYTLSVSARRDASNLFGVATNNKWTPLWSAGLAWQLSKESFYHIGWLPYLKLRATYGFSGNIDPTRSAVTTLVLSSPSSPSRLPTSRVDQFPNPNLRWEKVSQLNFGLDFSSKQDIINGVVEFYIKKGLDLYGDAPVDPTAGLNDRSVLTRNVANMKGTGVDLTINSKNIGRQFKWNSTLLINYYDSRTTKYYTDSARRSGSFINSGFSISPLEGKPLYSIVALRWAGLDSDGNPQGYYNKDVSSDYNNIVRNTRKEDLLYRSSLPEISGSLTNTFGYKRITIAVNIGFALGYYFLKPTISYTGLYANGATVGSADFAKRWQKPGDEKTTNVPSMIYPGNSYRNQLYTYAAVNVLRADNIRLHYINISYDLRPTKDRTHAAFFQLYLNASNLGILWKANKAGIDPDYLNQPVAAPSFALGIRCNF